MPPLKRQTSACQGVEGGEGAGLAKRRAPDDYIRGNAKAASLTSSSALTLCTNSILGRGALQTHVGSDISLRTNTPAQKFPSKRQISIANEWCPDVGRKGIGDIAVLRD